MPLVEEEALEMMDANDRELMLTRVKLETRSWFLRVSIALNVSLIAGIIVKVVS